MTTKLHPEDLRRRTMPCQAPEAATIPAPSPVLQARIDALQAAREHLRAAVASVGAVATTDILASVLAEESVNVDKLWIATLGDMVGCAAQVAVNSQNRRNARFQLGRDG